MINLNPQHNIHEQRLNVVRELSQLSSQLLHKRNLPANGMGLITVITELFREMHAKLKAHLSQKEMAAFYQELKEMELELKTLAKRNEDLAERAKKNGETMMEIQQGIEQILAVFLGSIPKPSETTSSLQPQNFTEKTASLPLQKPSDALSKKSSAVRRLITAPSSLQASSNQRLGINKGITKKPNREELAVKFLEILRKSKEPLPHRALGETFDLNEVESYEIIRSLREKGLLSKVGEGKNSKWTLNKSKS